MSVGGLLWLVGVLILELTFDSSDDDLPVSFSILAVMAGLGVGWGCWTSASFLKGRLARFGLRSVSVCSLVLGTGFGLDVVEEMFLGFLLSYFVGLFILPVAFLVLGFGVVKSAVYPTWAKWLPFAVFTVAAVTYLFHALARNVWDPSDGVWYMALGVGWVLLGFAIAGFKGSGESSGEPDRPMTAVR